MTYNRGCCQRGYTTRCYDFSGNTVWMANYYQGVAPSGMMSVNSQIIDANTVYVGGGRVTSGGTSWSVIAFDIVTGQKLWTRDVWADAGSPSANNAIVVQLQIDPTSGNIVAMLNALHFPAVGSPTYLNKTQYFVELDTSGNYVATHSFTLNNVGSIAPTNVVPAPIGFTIDSSGGYHILACNCVGNTFQEGWGFYEGTPPFGGTPTYTNISPYLTSYTFGPTGSGGSGFTSQYQLLPLSITRIGNADYVGGVSQNGYNSKYTLLNPSLIQGKSQTAAMAGTADIQQFFPAYAQTLTTSGTTDPSNATGVTQAAAMTMTVGNRYMFGPPFANSFNCAKLPNGTIGDTIAVHTGSNMALTIFPPVGGVITVFDGVTGLPTQDYTLSPTVMNLDFNSNPVHVNLALNAGQYIPRNATWVYYVCLGGGNWGAYVQSAAVMNSSLLSTTWLQNTLRNVPAVDSNGNVFCTTYKGYDSGELIKYDSAGVFQWYRGTGNLWVTTDSNDDVYAIGYRGGSSVKPSIVKRDNNGAYLWGHAHHGFTTSGYGATAYQNNGNPFGFSNSLIFNPSPTIQIDTIGSQMICSGQLAQPANDLSFMSDPDGDPVIWGRTASAGQAGNFSSFSIGFSGGAAAPGTWVVFSGAGNTGAMSISGGTNPWTQIGSTSFGAAVFIHLAAASEPATYSVTYSGAAPKDSAGGCLMEVLAAGSTNPDSSGASASTATCPNQTASIDLLEMSVITFGANATGVPTAPAGYTIRVSHSGSGSPIPYTAIATKEGLPIGSVAPGAWSLSGNLVSTIVFQP